MPYVKLQTNLTITPGDHPQLLHKLSKRVAELLGKPERFVMVALEESTQMLFGGRDTGCIYVELKSLGLQEGDCAEISTHLCEFLEAELEVSQDRIYIEFASPTRKMWGWDGGTF